MISIYNAITQNKEHDHNTYDINQAVSDLAKQLSNSDQDKK
jgi:hypothetical protein